MLSQDFGISIPNELLCYKKVSQFSPQKITKNYEARAELVKDSGGRILCTKMYNEKGEVTKVIYYKGAEISKKCYFNLGKLVQEEVLDLNRLVRKSFYDSSEQLICTYNYLYGKNGKVISISKIKDVTEITVKYGYDELQRINSREILINGKAVDSQHYRYDILDRIIEYKDKNQSIKVERISPKNELIYYTITDKIGNEISVKNNFDIDRIYKNTEISLNGHKITVSEVNYLDNIMLKKPYTNEDDLDIIISNLFNQNNVQTKRSNNNDMLNEKIQLNIQATTLPISIRKRLLYNTLVCA